MAQPTPFHRSASGRSFVPNVAKPTATHDFAAGHETLSNCAPGVGSGSTDTVQPAVVRRSAIRFWVPEDQVPTVMHTFGEVQDTSLNAHVVEPPRAAVVCCSQLAWAAWALTSTPGTTSPTTTATRADFASHSRRLMAQKLLGIMVFSRND